MEEKIEAAMPSIAGTVVAVAILLLWPWSVWTSLPVAALAWWRVRRLSAPDSRSVDSFS